MQHTLSTPYRDFRFSILVTVVALAGAFLWGQRWPEGPLAATWVALVLGIMKVTLSFDNAVVDACILRDMDAKWRRLFLAVGILIAVFGMRLVFPVVIVSAMTDMGIVETAQLAVENPEEYSHHLHANYTAISLFGGMLLLFVFYSFLFDGGRELHRLGRVEAPLARMGKLESVAITVALISLYIVRKVVPNHFADRLGVITSGLSGVVLFVLVDSIGSLFESEEEAEGAVRTAKRTGVITFLYLELLDDSFSFDGVIGPFAITRDVIIIMLGLAIGAMFVRSLTVFLIDRGTLDQYVFLEHGAHYGIGAMAIIMFISISADVPEALTGAVGLAFIVAAVISSIGYRRRHDARSAAMPAVQPVTSEEV